MGHFRNLALGASVIATASLAVQAQSEPGSAPVAVYWMSVQTTTGMGAGGTQRPTMMQMMSQNGRADQFNRTLTLQLGSQRQPTGAPAAEHDPPGGLGVGPMLPLVTPQATPVHEETEPGPPPQYRQPQGKMLIFWGCGEHAGPGQPLVVDFASLTSQQGAARFAELMHAVQITPMQPPSPGRNTTYGEWPNPKATVSVPPTGSLVGDHTVRGNYSPDIHFTLGQGQDFMPAFNMTQNVRNPTGSATLGWQPMTQARGYFAGMFGAQQQNEVVMWTSSQVESLAFGMPEYLSDSEIARLVDAHVLMPPTQTSCTIPEEAVRAAGQAGFFQMTAFGGEVNFSYPERPPPPKPWHALWTVKVRYRSATNGLVGMNMNQMMMGGRGDESDNSQRQQQQQQQQQQQHHGFGDIMRGLGGFVP